jgi:hypothetical protein
VALVFFVSLPVGSLGQEVGSGDDTGGDADRSEAIASGLVATKETFVFRTAPALRQSGLFLAIQHSYRFATEPGTRTNLRGPYFRDWGRAVRGIRGWEDGDNTFTNYVGHPMMGAVGGWIYLQNDPPGAKLPFSTSGNYWRSRLRAMGWSAAYSTLFELGPASETALGNVGLPPASLNGLVDMVATPTMGTGVLVAEDVLDRYVVSAIEKSTRNRALIMFSRGLLNPNRAFANMLRWKWPWYRDTRPDLRHFHHIR